MTDRTVLAIFVTAMVIAVIAATTLNVDTAVPTSKRARNDRFGSTLSAVATASY